MPILNHCTDHDMEQLKIVANWQMISSSAPYTFHMFFCSNCYWAPKLVYSHLWLIRHHYCWYLWLSIYIHCLFFQEKRRMRGEGRTFRFPKSKSQEGPKNWCHVYWWRQLLVQHLNCCHCSILGHFIYRINNLDYEIWIIALCMTIICKLCRFGLGIWINKVLFPRHKEIRYRVI